MSRRTITLEFNEEFFARLEGLAAKCEYKSAHDYAFALVATYVFEEIKYSYKSAGSTIEDEYEFDYEDSNELDTDDGIPF